MADLIGNGHFEIRKGCEEPLQHRDEHVTPLDRAFVFKDSIWGEDVRESFEIPPIERSKVFLRDSIR